MGNIGAIITKQSHGRIRKKSFIFIPSFFWTQLLKSWHLHTNTCLSCDPGEAHVGWESLEVQELSACILGWQPKKPNHLYEDGILRPSLLTSKDGRKLNFRLLYQVPVAYNAYLVPPLQRPLTTGFREGRIHCCAGWVASLERTWRLCVTCSIPDTKYLFICFSLKFLPS